VGLRLVLRRSSWEKVGNEHSEGSGVKGGIERLSKMEKQVQMTMVMREEE